MPVPPPPTVSTRGFDPARRLPVGPTDGLPHWCVVTTDLEATTSRLRAQYGVPGFLVIEPAPLYDVTFHGRPVDLRVDMALGYVGDVTVEVLRPHPDGATEFFGTFLAEHPAGGVQHLGFGFGADRYAAAYAGFEARTGPAVLAGRSGLGTRFAYFDTRAATGLYTEILSFDDTSLALSDALRAGDLARLTGQVVP